MKKLFLASAALASLVAGSALAADLPVKSKAPVPVYSWTGCYGGVNIGATYWQSDLNWTPNPLGFTAASIADITSAIGPHRGAGVIAGGEVGCNYQTGVTVWGFEGDFNYTGVDQTQNTQTAVFNDAITERVRSNWLSTLRGRAGYSNYGYTSFGPWMFYLTAGVAFANLQFQDTIFFPPSGTTNTASSNQTKTGWTAGAGLEWAMFGNWTMKVEYLYVDFGSVSYTSTNNGAFPLATILHDHRFNEQIARFGWNYRFGWGPVVANY
jgi:outer membrane immunogenic protein